MSARDAKEIGAVLAARRGHAASEHGQTYLAARIALRLEDLRTASGLTQRALAERVGTSRPHISRLLSGRYAGLTITTLARLALALDCEIDVVFRPTRRGHAGGAKRGRRRAA